VLSKAWILGAIAALSSADPADRAAIRIHVPDEGVLPPLADRAEPLPGTRAVTVSPDGTRIALLSWTRPVGRAARSVLHIVDAGLSEPVAVEVGALVRDALLAADGSAVWAVAHEAAKRGPGRTELLRIEIDTQRARPILLLPASARSLAFWPRAGALLVACSDEIRTLRLPELTSGPLYALPGVNLSLAALGGARILVGREDAVLLVDLDDRPARDAMPVRASVAMPSPVVALAAAPDGRTALAGLSDGRVLRVEIDAALELRVASAGTGLVATRATPVSVASFPQEEVPAPAQPPPDPPPGRPPVQVDPPRQESAIASPVEERPEDPQPAPPAVEPTAGAVLHGRVTGPAASAVVSVVVLGPDSVVREARRVAPGPDGRFRVGDLAPGRYRVVVDAGGSRVLVTRPPFHVVDVREEEPAPLVADFEVLQSH
jgi:hypothetical protein